MVLMAPRALQYFPVHLHRESWHATFQATKPLLTPGPCIVDQEQKLNEQHFLQCRCCLLFLCLPNLSCSFSHTAESKPAKTRKPTQQGYWWGKDVSARPFLFLAVRNRTQVHTGTHRLTEEVSQEWRKNSSPSSQGCWMPHTALVYGLPFLLYVLSRVFPRAWGTSSPCGHPYTNHLKFLAHPPHPGSGRVARLTVFPPFVSYFLSISAIVSDTGNSPLSEGNS